MAKLVSKTQGDALFEVALERKTSLMSLWMKSKRHRPPLKKTKNSSKLMSHPKIKEENQDHHRHLQEKFPKNLLDSP